MLLHSRPRRALARRTKPESLRRRPGVTRPEIAVLLALVAVLTGLLLPAVQKLRETAARARCADNLRSVGEAFRKFHDANGVLPQGGDSGPGGGPARPGERAEWSWAYHLGPFLRDAPPPDAPCQTIDRTPVPSLYCPSRRTPSPGVAALDYAGNAGSRPDGSNGTILQGNAPRLAIGDIEDGAAATLLAAERRLNGSRLGTGVSDREPSNRAGWDANAQAYRLGTETPARDWYDAASDDASTRFGSAHRSGLNALFADGSVRHFGYDIDPGVWLRACVRDDTGPQPMAD